MIFILSKAIFLILTNHLVDFLAVGVSSRPVLQQLHGVRHVSHGQGDIGRGLQPGGSTRGLHKPSIPVRLTAYTEVGRALHGETWDLATEPLSGETIMRAGGGKKHRRYWIANSLVDTASTPSLTQLRASTIDSTPPICPRPETSMASVHQRQG